MTDTVRFVPISPNHVSMVPLTGVLCGMCCTAVLQGE